MTKLPLVLCPGLLCDEALWESQVEALSEVAEIWIPELTTQTSMTAMGATVLREAPWPRFALAGLSMGGYVALEAWVQAPQRIRGLALLDARAQPETPADTAKRRQLIELVRGERGFAALTRQLLPLMVHPSRLGEPTLALAIAGMAERIGLAAYERQQAAIISRRDFRPELAAIAVPTLVLCGREDLITPLVCSEEMAALIPDARLVIVEDCGHMSTMERPARVNSALRDWLASMPNP